MIHLIHWDRLFLLAIDCLSKILLMIVGVGMLGLIGYHIFGLFKGLVIGE